MRAKDSQGKPATLGLQKGEKTDVSYTETLSVEQWPLGAQEVKVTHHFRFLFRTHWCFPKTLQ